jgi:UDP-glucuronate 4-epimerase
VKLLVTGAAGFIGSHLADRLLADGHRVVGLDSFDPFYEPDLKRFYLRGALVDDGFALVEGDVREEAAWARAARAGGDEADDGAFDAVVHLAALAGVRPSIDDPVRYQDVNVGGTQRALEFARRHDVGRFVFGSSSSVYGEREEVPFSEDDRVDHPISPSPYAATKRAGELLCHTHHHLFDLDVLCLRFFTVYGPRQRPDLAIHKFTRLIDLIGEATGVEPEVEVLPEQPGDVGQTYADVSRARRLLGYDPSVSIEEGIGRFVAWFREHEERLV